MSEADFSHPGGVAVLFAAILIAVPPWHWLYMKRWGDKGFLTEDDWKALIERIHEKGGWCCNCIGYVSNDTALLVMEWIRRWALAIVIGIYLAAGANFHHDGFYIAIFVLFLVTCAFHTAATGFFIAMSRFGPSLLCRIVEFLALLAIAIVEIVELSSIHHNPHFGEGLALAIVVSLLVLYEAIVLLPRSIAFNSLPPLAFLEKDAPPGFSVTTVIPTTGHAADDKKHDEVAATRKKRLPIRVN